MQNYKDINGNLHALSDADIANGGINYLPVGFIEITQAEAEAIVNPVPTLPQAKAAKLITINQHCTDLLAAVKAGYPDDEVQSWSKQESEARAYTANSAAPTLLLSALATARQIPIDTLAARVVQKADLFAVVSGQIIGTRQRCEDLINVAADEAALNAITWS